MRQPNRETDPRTPDGRKPGRSFEDPNRPLGHELIESAPEGGEDIASVAGVADRAKAVAILRKAEEFMATDNPSPRTQAGMHRALELAAGRMGLSIEEYDRIVKGDAELQKLERRVLEANIEPTTH